MIQSFTKIFKIESFKELKNKKVQDLKIRLRFNWRLDRDNMKKF